MALSKQAQDLNEKLNAIHYRQQLLAAFSQPKASDLISAIQPNRFKPNIQQKRQRLRGGQLLTLAQPANGLHKTIMMFHGGGFVLAASNAFREVALYFVKAGFRVVIADYPLIPTVSAQALRQWALDAYQMVQTQEGPLIVFGDSAGANIALRLALDLTPKQVADSLMGLELVSLCPDLTFASADVKARAQADLVLDRTGIKDYQAVTMGAAGMATFSFTQQRSWPSLGVIRIDSGANEFMVPDVERVAAGLAKNPDNQVKVNIHPGLVHDFIMWQWLPETQATLAGMVSFFKKLDEK
ncbi:alpha/beta hydrolase [Weissella halotolerans]|uniref:Alpha/beta hydrolase fold-3 domain-containing protein n=2 Tax=Weissella halotolerans TaxID=1615 RepID=A0A0R2FYC8_9LACO|nr:alpha/beta hydrolase [Weissella halotolerans]KRN33427.1 hypothetical protein IV68_GL000227 [Weissella halotolerans DSM 20190]